MTNFLTLHYLLNFFFSVTAVDNQNVSASPVDVAIILCSGCNSHGACNYNSTRSTTSSMFNLASCVCYTGYDGNLNNKICYHGNKEHTQRNRKSENDM